MHTFTESQDDRYGVLLDRLEQYGFICLAEPIAGSEELFLETVAADLAKLDETAEFQRRKYGMKGMSKRLIQAVQNWHGGRKHGLCWAELIPCGATR